MGNTQKKELHLQECHIHRIDFEICERKLGFNDKTCKYHLSLFEQCMDKLKQNRR